MQNICNLIGWKSVHISDIFNCHSANIKGTWNARKLGGIYKTFELILTSLKRTSFRAYLLSRAKWKSYFGVLIFTNNNFLKISRVLIFVNGKSLKMSSLQINFSPKEKRIRKRQLNKWRSANVSIKINGKAGRSRWKNSCYWLSDSKKRWINQHFCAYFFEYLFSRNMNFVDIWYVQWNLSIADIPNSGHGMNSGQNI